MNNNNKKNNSLASKKIYVYRQVNSLYSFSRRDFQCIPPLSQSFKVNIRHFTFVQSSSLDEQKLIVLSFPIIQKQCFPYISADIAMFMRCISFYSCRNLYPVGSLHSKMLSYLDTNAHMHSSEKESKKNSSVLHTFRRKKKQQTICCRCCWVLSVVFSLFSFPVSSFFHIFFCFFIFCSLLSCWCWSLSNYAAAVNIIYAHQYNLKWVIKFWQQQFPFTSPTQVFLTKKKKTTKYFKNS